MAEPMKKGDRVSEQDKLLRRVYRRDKRYRDPKTGALSSRAFAPRPKDNGRLSVDIERLCTLDDAIRDPVKFILYKLPVSLVYRLGLDCIYDPITEGSFKNLAHALILGFDANDESVPGILARKSLAVDYP